jgi:hypothetical protein
MIIVCRTQNLCNVQKFNLFTPIRQMAEAN